MVVSQAVRLKEPLKEWQFAEIRDASEWNRHLAKTLRRAVMLDPTDGVIGLQLASHSFFFANTRLFKWSTTKQHEFINYLVSF